MNKKTNKARDAGTNENLLAKTICILHGTLWDREDRFSDVKRAQSRKLPGMRSACCNQILIIMRGSCKIININFCCMNLNM